VVRPVRRGPDDRARVAAVHGRTGRGDDRRVRLASHAGGYTHTRSLHSSSSKPPRPPLAESPTPSRLRSTSSRRRPSPFPPVRCRDAATGGRSRSRASARRTLSDWSLAMASNQPAENRPASPETPIRNTSGSRSRRPFGSAECRSTRAHAPTAALRGKPERRQPRGTGSTYRQLVSRGLSGRRGSEPHGVPNDSRFRANPGPLPGGEPVLLPSGLRVSGRFDDGRHSLD